jgi:hypothetical protein
VLEKEITWRSWWDGGSTGGPIASEWNVHGWPTLYLVDYTRALSPIKPSATGIWTVGLSNRSRTRRCKRVSKPSGDLFLVTGAPKAGLAVAAFEGG